MFIGGGAKLDIEVARGVGLDVVAESEGVEVGASEEVTAAAAAAGSDNDTATVATGVAVPEEVGNKVD